MVLPPGAPVQGARVDKLLVKALARAFRWRRMLDSGEFATIKELAEREKIASSYLTRLLGLTLLAPAVVEAILDGRQPGHVALDLMCRPFPLEWGDQRRRFMPR